MIRTLVFCLTMLTVGLPVSAETIKVAEYKEGQVRFTEREKVVKSDEEWKTLLPGESFGVMRKKGTELPFRNKYDKHYEKGVYRCLGCGTDLFLSADKYDSGTGWPSFTKPIAAENIATETDRKLFIERTEVLCAVCGAHLGHVFDDGPQPTGLRYCMNSASFDFAPEQPAKDAK